MKTLKELIQEAINDGYNYAYSDSDSRGLYEVLDNSIDDETQGVAKSENEALRLLGYADYIIDSGYFTMCDNHFIYDLRQELLFIDED